VPVHKHGPDTGDHWHGGKDFDVTLFGVYAFRKSLCVSDVGDTSQV
jgi:hypothetical protein